MKLARRILTVERALGGPHFVSWDEYNAAYQRLQTAMVAKMKAMAFGGPEPVIDPVQREADGRVLERWRRQCGIPESDPNEVKARLVEQFRRMTSNPTWTWSDAHRSPAAVNP
ncbi:MAG: hypothetical protein JST54_28965 [Deltaproteobacteria bacterium]|nr:hypothetical protein [Deltaproteobacteria bacterium]